MAEELALDEIARQRRQLTVMNGPVARAELAWTARATSSLPVPDSPISSTVISVRATRPTSLKTSIIAEERPTSVSGSDTSR